MTIVGGVSRAWFRCLALAAAAAVVLPGLVGFAGGSATAAAFSSPGLGSDTSTCHRIQWAATSKSNS
jgi:hypothetical protein